MVRSNQAGLKPTQKTLEASWTDPDGSAVIGVLQSPLTTYYLLFAASTALLVLGLVMVFSASSVAAMIDGGSAYAMAARQVLFAGLGSVVVAVVARWRVSTWRRVALPMMVAALVLEAAVFTPLGKAVNGNRNWIMVGPLQLQPSELAKVGVVLLGALILSNRAERISSPLMVVVPFLVPFSAVVVALILAGRDLGTAMIVFVIIAAVLAVGGVPAWFFGVAGGLGTIGIAAMVVTSANRLDRISNWLSPACQSDPNGACGQSVHGLYALADGGWWGVGLGASKEKWEWLSEAQNDFIFAIIGEELGLPGTLLVLALFAIVAWAAYRLISRTQDRFVRIAGAGVLAWVLGQAVINIGAVIGLFPVIGVTLPLVSAGGTSLVSTMLAIGMLLSFVRNEPGCRELLDARPSVLARAKTVFGAVNR